MQPLLDPTGSLVAIPALSLVVGPDMQFVSLVQLSYKPAPGYSHLPWMRLWVVAATFVSGG